MKTNIIGFKEFRESAEKYISRINAGESFTVLRRSKPIFKITPIEDEEIWETVADFTLINPAGVPVRDLIKALRKNNG
jgi:antitoxin (DNA-binding transcriptional repressor) of toxin-antitoxin stability system